MLKVLRGKKVKKIMLWALAILIVPAFALTGVAYLNSNKKYIAKMYGKKIFNSDFIEYQRMFGAYLRLNFGPRFNLDLNSEKMYNDLWENYILTQKAKADKVKVENDELVAFMQTLFAMNAGGQFNQQAYLGFLKQANIVPAQFERFLKNMIAAQKVVEERAKALVVSDEELLDAYKADNEIAKIEYIFVSERETQKYLEIYSDDNALLKHYEENKDKFKSLPEAQIRYIVVDKLPNDFDIAKMNTLDDVAKTLSAEIKTSDFFNATTDVDSTIKANSFVAQTALDAKLNTLVGPLPNNEQKVFFEKNASKESKALEFGQALEQVKKSYAFNNAIDKAKEIAQATFTKAKETNDLAVAASQYQLKNVITDEFKLADEIDDKLLAYPPFNKAIFDLSENTLLDEAFRFDYGWCIAKRIDFKAYDQAKFKETKAELKAKLLNEKKELDYKKLLREIREESNLTFNRNQ